MSQHEDQVRLRHMLSRAREAVDLGTGRSCEDLRGDRVRQLALVRLIEIVGEAATRVSKSTQEDHPEIPWPQIVGTRNRLIHGYDMVDHDILWATMEHDLPPLKASFGSTPGMIHRDAAEAKWVPSNIRRNQHEFPQTPTG